MSSKPETAPETVQSEVTLPEIPAGAAQMIIEAYQRQAMAAQSTQAIVGVVLATLGLDPKTHGVRVDETGMRVVRVDAS